MRHDPPAYRVVIRDQHVKFVDLNFFSQIKNISKAHNSDNLWKNLEDHVQIAVVNLCRSYDHEHAVLSRLQADVMKHQDIRTFCEQYGIALVSMQIQSVSASEEAIKLREASNL